MRFDDVKRVVLAVRPQLAKTLKKNGKLTVARYGVQSTVCPPGAPQELREQLESVLHCEIEAYGGQRVADSALTEFQKNYYVSTADHHGPVAHPFFLSGLLLQSFLHQQRSRKHIFVFSCGGISLNNSSFPRGVSYHTKDLMEARWYLFSLKHKHRPVYGYEAFGESHIRHMVAEWQRQQKVLKVGAVQSKKLTALIKNVFLNPVVLSGHYFSEQITRLNYLLWTRLPGQEKMQLHYLELESIVGQLLLRFHLYQSTLVHQLLFERKYRRAFAKSYDGIQGSFSSKSHTGTFLFWGVKDNNRIPLTLVGNTLQNKKHHFIVRLTPDAIKDALEKRELMPSLALSYSLLSFYYGVTCGGGFSQGDYLTNMKKAWQNFLVAVGEKCPNYFAKITTNYVAADYALTYLTSGRTVVPATALDVVLYGKKVTSKKLAALFASVTLEQAVDAMIPDLYKLVSGQKAEVSQQPVKPCLHV